MAMTFEPDPPIMDELTRWCLQRIAGRDARHARMPWLLTYFADLFPRQMPMITVAGTAGKGTMCVLLEAILTADRRTTGVFTKPHLHSYRERIRVGGQCVSTAELADHVELIFSRLRGLVQRHGDGYRPSLFEALLFVAASIFRQRGVDMAVFEAGVGGANDATSFVPARASVVTSVALDHETELGNTIEAIARDKAGIAPEGGVLVLGAGLAAGPRSVIQSACAVRRVRCVQAGDDMIEVVSSSLKGQQVRVAGRKVVLPLVGVHQARNLATAWTLMQVLHELGLVANLDAIRGVEHAQLPGRFEFVPGSPSWLLDVAHNPAALEALWSTITEFFSREQVLVILGATEPHDYRSFAKIVSSWQVPIGLCEGFPKAIPTEALAQEFPADRQPFGLFRTPAEAIGFLAQDKAHARMTVLVTGSLFLVGQWRHELAERGLLADM
jgi:folylpolyglutamate synthase/dihydrofolate synthase